MLIRMTFQVPLPVPYETPQNTTNRIKVMGLVKGIQKVSASISEHGEHGVTS
jgi:hypothetical protein